MRERERVFFRQSSRFNRTFGARIKALWDKAHKLNKPTTPMIAWTCGIARGRGEFLDLQTHGIALAASIIINEPVVPRIIFAWDSPIDINTMKWDTTTKQRVYPLYMLQCFPQWREEFIEKEHVFDAYEFHTQYVDCYRSWLSVNPLPCMLGYGYRAKYLGINYATTPYGIISDIDTICRMPCIEYITSEVAKSPESFVWAGWHDDIQMNVGLCVYNLRKYRDTFLPRFSRISWAQRRRDSEFVPAVRREFPEVADQLDIRLLGNRVISVEKYYTCARRGNIWDEQNSVHYHAWKGEMERDFDGFAQTYSGILDELERKANHGNIH